MAHVSGIMTRGNLLNSLKGLQPDLSIEHLQLGRLVRSIAVQTWASLQTFPPHDA